MEGEAPVPMETDSDSDRDSDGDSDGAELVDMNFLAQIERIVNGDESDEEDSGDQPDCDESPTLGATQPSAQTAPPHGAGGLGPSAPQSTPAAISDAADQGPQRDAPVSLMGWACEAQTGWACPLCTLWNPPLFLACAACTTICDTGVLQAGTRPSPEVVDLTLDDED
jgi:hypothetical protein